MSAPGMWANIATAARKRCHDYRTTRRIILGFEMEMRQAEGEAAREGLQLVLRELREYLANTWPEGIEAERGA